MGPRRLCYLEYYMFWKVFELKPNKLITINCLVVRNVEILTIICNSLTRFFPQICNLIKQHNYNKIVFIKQPW